MFLTWFANTAVYTVRALSITKTSRRPNRMYQLDEFKGLCFSPSKSSPHTPTVCSGLDRLNWAAVLPQHEIKVSEASVESEKSAKPTRQERKELKRRNAAAKRAQAAAGLDKKVASQPEFNAYLTTQRLKALHSQIKRLAPPNTKLAQFGLVALYPLDLDHLLPEEWLDDNNISFVYEALQTFFLKGHKFGHHIQLLFPAPVQLLLHFPEEELAAVLPKEVAQLKLVFLPFNYIAEDEYVDLEEANNGDHWALCVLSIPEKRLFVYDLMAFDDEDDLLLMQLAARLQKALFKPSEKIQVVKMKCDQQDNFDDCGVFLIMFSCCLVARLLSEEPVDLVLGHVKFNPLQARLEIMEAMAKLALEAQKLAET